MVETKRGTKRLSMPIWTISGGPQHARREHTAWAAALADARDHEHHFLLAVFRLPVRIVLGSASRSRPRYIDGSFVFVKMYSRRSTITCRRASANGSNGRRALR